MNTQEWLTDALKSGKLFDAIKKLRTTVGGGYRNLCDNEGFSASKAAKTEHAKKNIELLQILARSPDLSPIEMFWGWVRKQMRLKERLRGFACKACSIGQDCFQTALEEILADT